MADKKERKFNNEPAYKIADLINEKIVDENTALKHDYYLYGKGRPDDE